MALTPLWDGFSYKSHQVTGIKWMQARESALPCGGIVCDEMGLGKTIQLLGLIKCDAVKSLTLMIAPVAVLGQWEATAYKSGINVFRAQRIGGFLQWKSYRRYRPGGHRLHVIGYEMARNNPALVKMMSWDRIICDEAHRAASAIGFRRVIADIVAPKRWFLTATPIVNSIKDLEHILTLLGVPEAHEKVMNLDAAAPLFKDIILARTMEQLRSVIPDAPAKPIIHELSLPFETEDEAEFYRGMSGLIVRRWKALDSDGGAGAALMKLKLFMRLRQLSLHPQVFIEARRKALGHLYERPDWLGSSTKFEAIKRLVREGLNDPKPHKWIIFCHFHPEMEILKAALQAEPWIPRVSLYNGSLSHHERKEVLEGTVEPLNDGEAEILLVQLQSGGTGLNLQHFDRIVFTGPWWTSALMEQAIGRAVRIGQTEQVHVYHLKLAEEEAINIDAVMMEKAATKGEMCREVLSAACHDI